jgi:hypothetical protein
MIATGARHCLIDEATAMHRVSYLFRSYVADLFNFLRHQAACVSLGSYLFVPADASEPGTGQPQFRRRHALKTPRITRH